MLLKNLYQNLRLSDLVVSPENDRHGELEIEQEAINWLLENLAERMKKLAKDIAEKGFIYDPPLVKSEGKKYKIYDGNRRVSCLKLIHNPALANDPKFQAFFKELKDKSQITDTVNCRIEDDLQAINDIIFRRHAGGETGIGQMDWEPEAKGNYMRRNGLPYKPNFGYEINQLLRDEGILTGKQKLPSSNFNRLFSSEDLRKKVGLSFKDNQIQFTHKKDKVLSILRRIASDLMTKEVVLDDIWSNEDKKDYLARLSHEGVAVTDTDLISAEEKPAPKAPDPKPTIKPQQQKKIAAAVVPKRLTLIPGDLEIEFGKTPDLTRIRSVVVELQTYLFLNKPINAIAVSFRVLIEMCTDHYNDCHKLNLKPDNKLHVKVNKVAEDMQAKGFIEPKYAEMINKFSQQEEILSAHTFNNYVHNRHIMPSEQHLTSMWDTLQKFMLVCFKADN